MTTTEERIRAAHPTQCPKCGAAGPVPDFSAPHRWECTASECGHIWDVEPPASLVSVPGRPRTLVVPGSAAIAERGPMTDSIPLSGKLSIVSYDLPAVLDFERWRSIGSTLQSLHRAINWWIGDWLLYGERHFGDEAYQAVRDQITEILGRSDESIGQAIWVAQQFPPETRRRELRWSHHREVLLTELPRAERFKLLDVAVERRLFTRDLGDLARARADELARDPAPRQVSGGSQFSNGQSGTRVAEAGSATPNGIVLAEPPALPARPVLIALPPPETDDVEVDEDVTVRRSEVLRVMQELDMLRTLVDDYARHVGQTLTRQRGEARHQQRCRIGQFIDGYSAPYGAPCSMACAEARDLLGRRDAALAGWERAS